MKTNRPHGFTLIELMIALVIIAILMVIGLPSMSEFIKNERLTSQINSLNSYLQYARSEAITRHSQVIVCASSSGSSCSGGDWQDGWLVYIDKDEDGSYSSGDEITRVHDALKGDTTIGSTGGSEVVYDNRGFSPDSSATFSICDDRGASKGKSITISNTGRVRQGGTVTCS